MKTNKAIAEWLEYTGFIATTAAAGGGQGDEGVTTAGEANPPEPASSVGMMVADIVAKGRAAHTAKIKSQDQPIGPLLASHALGD